MMAVHPSGFYAWCAEPDSRRALEGQRLLGPIKQSWLESGAVYGYRKVSDDLRDLGEQCGINRVHLIMRAAGLHSQTGYGKRRFKRSGPAAVVAPNHLQRQFDVTEPNKVWVTDTTYVCTYEGWLYLAAVLDLFSRQVIGWSLGSRMDRELALRALLMAVWRRKPQRTVMVHSDQGSQFGSYDWRDFLKAHNLEQSMSRRGNCHDNAVAESFFQLLKRERIRRRIYIRRDEARQDVFDYIEMFYNQRRRHSFSNYMSPVEYEKQYFQRLGSVLKSRNDSADGAISGRATGSTFCRSLRYDAQTDNSHTCALSWHFLLMSFHRPIFHTHPRLTIALLIGTAISLILPSHWKMITRILTGWNVGVWAYLLLMGILMVRASNARVRKIAEREDKAGVAVLAVMSLAAALSLVAIVVELATTKNLSSSQRLVHYAFTGSTVIGSWLLVATIYTFHYANLFYRSAPEQRCLRFPDDERNPDYWDFLYFSFTIAVAAQTSDISVMSRTMRKAVMAQSILSFLFNAAIIGMTINIAAGLVGA